MNDPNTPMLTQIKLAEMERQRSRLSSQYEQIEQQAADTNNPVERLRRLYEGLPLHLMLENRMESTSF